MSTNDKPPFDLSDRPSSIIRETSAGTAAERGEQSIAPMGDVAWQSTAISKRRDANAETSAVGAHSSPENGSTSPVSNRIKWRPLFALKSDVFCQYSSDWSRLDNRGEQQMAKQENAILESVIWSITAPAVDSAMRELWMEA
jgi:hypothetical protein